MHTHVGSVSPWATPGSSEPTEGQQVSPTRDFRDGETEGQGGGDTCPESHSPEGWSQALSGQPDPKTLRQARPRLWDQELVPTLCFLRISMPGLFVGTANLARPPQTLLSELRLLRGKHAQDAPSVEIMLGQDRKGLGRLQAHTCPQQKQELSSFQPPWGGPYRGPEQQRLSVLWLGVHSRSQSKDLSRQWHFYKGSLNLGCHHLGDPPSALPG